MRREVLARCALLEFTSSLLRGKSLGVAQLRNEIRGAVEFVAIDDDLDRVAFAHASDRAAGERFRRNVSDTRASGNAAETRVGEHGDILTGGQGLQRGGDLINLMHACARRTLANQHHYVRTPDGAALDRVDRGGF